MSALGHRDLFAADLNWLDGTSEGIKYALLRLDETDQASPTVILSKFAPGAAVSPHTHNSNYLEYIIEGEQAVGKVTYRAGDIRIVRGGTGYGPIKVGPHGCTVLIVFQDGRGIGVELLPRKAATGAAGPQ
jgi:anti-sigma factor ChrR (cupin superfamily)